MILGDLLAGLLGALSSSRFHRPTRDASVSPHLRRLGRHHYRHRRRQSLPLLQGVRR